MDHYLASEGRLEAGGRENPNHGRPRVSTSRLRGTQSPSTLMAAIWSACSSLLVWRHVRSWTCSCRLQRRRPSSRLPRPSRTSVSEPSQVARWEECGTMIGASMAMAMANLVTDAELVRMAYAVEVVQRCRRRGTPRHPLTPPDMKPSVTCFWSAT